MLGSLVPYSSTEISSATGCKESFATGGLGVYKKVNKKLKTNNYFKPPMFFLLSNERERLEKSLFHVKKIKKSIFGKTRFLNKKKEKPTAKKRHFFFEQIIRLIWKSDFF